MGFVKPRKGYFEAHYSVAKGQYEAIRDITGKPVQYPTKRLAEQEADHREVELRRDRSGDSLPAPRPVTGVRSGPAARADILFHDWAEIWYAGLDLARTSMSGYKSGLQAQLFPEFGTKWLLEITAPSITAWVQKLRAAGYKDESIRTWRHRDPAHQRNKTLSATVICRRSVSIDRR